MRPRPGPGRLVYDSCGVGERGHAQTSLRSLSCFLGRAATRPKRMPYSSARSAVVAASSQLFPWYSVSVSARLMRPRTCARTLPRSRRKATATMDRNGKLIPSAHAGQWTPASWHGTKHCSVNLLGTLGFATPPREGEGRHQVTMARSSSDRCLLRLAMSRVVPYLCSLGPGCVHAVCVCAYLVVLRSTAYCRTGCCRREGDLFFPFFLSYSFFVNPIST